MQNRHVAAAEDDGGVLGVAVDVAPGEYTVSGRCDVGALAVDVDLAVADDGDVERVRSTTGTGDRETDLAAAAADDVAIIAGYLNDVVNRCCQRPDVAQRPRLFELHLSA